MAGTFAHSSTAVWILLSEALALVAIYVGSPAAAKEFLLHYLRSGGIRWIYWKQEGEFDDSETYSWFLRHSRIHDRFDPGVDTENRWWTFWITDDPASRIRNRQVTVDGEQSSAICTASASEFGAAAHYKLSLIRLHREDVIDKLRLAALLPWEPSQVDQRDVADDVEAEAEAERTSEPVPEPVPEPASMLGFPASPDECKRTTKPESALKEWLSDWMKRNPDEGGVEDNYNIRAYESRPAEFKHIEQKTVSNRVAENRKIFGWASARRRPKISS